VKLAVAVILLGIAANSVNTEIGTAIIKSVTSKKKEKQSEKNSVPQKKKLAALYEKLNQGRYNIIPYGIYTI